MSTKAMPLGITLLIAFMIINGVSLAVFPLIYRVAVPEKVAFPILGGFCVISALGLSQVKRWGFWSAVSFHLSVIAYNVFVIILGNWLGVFPIFTCGIITRYLLSEKVRIHFTHE